MADIASLGFSADTGALKDTKASLDALVPSAQRAEQATNSFSAAASGVTGAVGGAAAGIRSFGNAVQQAATGGGGLSKTALMSSTALSTVQQAAVGASAQLGTLGGSVTRLGLNFAQADAHVEAYKASLVGLKPASEGAKSSLDRLGKAANDNINRMQSTPGNIAAQFQDIGVTAAAGMSPMLIALQQGTQLSAAFAGGGLRNLGAAIGQLLSPVSLLTIGFVALVAIGIQWAMKAFDASTATDQLAKSLKAGVAEADFFGEAQSNIGKVFDITTGKLKNHNVVLQQYVKLQAQANILAAQAARMDATKAVESAGKPSFMENIKSGLSGLGASAGDPTGLNTAAGGQAAARAFANMQSKLQPLQGVLGEFSSTVNGASLTVDGLNKATDRAISGIDNLAKAHKLANRDIIATKKAVLDLATARGQEFANSDVVTSINQGHLTPSLVTPRTHNERQNKSNPWGDLVEGAQNDAAAEIARGKAINMTAEAAATLTEKTKLLNEARSHEINLTPEQRTEIDRLAAAYGRAKVEADRLIATHELTLASDADLTNLKEQGDLIGLYGEKLAYAAEYAKQYAAAKAKFGNDKQGLMFFAGTQISASAEAYANQSAANDNKKYMSDANQAYLNQTRILAQQKAAIGLSADETNRLSNEQLILNDALARHITLSDGDIEALLEQADATSLVQNAIRKTKEALDFTRDSVKGFVSDLQSGLEQGKGFFSSFTDAVLNMLTKVVDKLTELALDSALGGGGTSPRGFIGALGKMFGIGGGGGGGLTASVGATMDANPGLFAHGAAFTNGIVSEPTLFRFAKGASLGQMGEAGPEAIMPLKRGSDGSLGVQMHGTAANNNGPPVVNINNHYNISGSSTADMQATVRASANQTRDQLRREVPAILAEYQHNGGVN